jgi:hypothetical protein
MDPASVLGRLQTLGFAAITVMVADALTFVAVKAPAPPAPADGS